MKKILLILTLFLVLGCERDLNNTPTKKVEIFLGNYQSLSDEVEAKISSDVDQMPDLTKEQKKEYIALWNKHYQGLTYEIKDEIVDGDDATIVTEIEVYDYSKILSETSNFLSENQELFFDEEGNYSSAIFNDYRLKSLKNASDKVKYTIEFKAKKINKKWILQDLTEDEYLKLSGMYVY